MRASVLAAMVCYLGLCGCGNSDPTGEIVKVVPASGVLTYQGKPLPNYEITLLPEGDGRPATATTDAEGRFQLGTNGPGDGAPPGQHRVAVNYQGDIVTGEPGKEEFQAPPPPPVQLPEKFSDAAKSGVTVQIPDQGSDALKIELN